MQSGLDVQRFEAVGHVPASSTGTLVTSAAGANAKTAAWVELIAATAFDAGLLVIQPGGLVGTASLDTLTDIAIGGSGAEVVLLENLLTTYNAIASPVSPYAFPIGIPAGSRLSAKSQATAGSGAVRVAASVYGQGFGQGSPCSHVTTYGAATADSGGTSVDPGGSAHALAWTQVTASTTRDHSGFIVGIGNQVNTARTTATWLISLGVGAGGSEQIIHTWLAYATTAGDVIFPGTTPFIPAWVPAGSRLAVGARCSITDATDRLFDAVIYGVS